MNSSTRNLPATALAALLSLAAATPLQAQDHSAHSLPMAKEPVVDPKAKPATSTSTVLVDHAAMDHSAMDHAGMEMMTPVPASPAAAKRADAEMDHSTMDHSTTDQSNMDHSTMDHSTMDHSTMDHGPPQDRQTPAPLPPVTAADRAAAFPEVMAHGMRDKDVHSYFLANRFETWDADAGKTLLWEGQAWIGTDTKRLWIRSEGERSGGDTEAADLELLYGHSISPWWDVVVGMKQDFAPGSSQTWAAAGVMGVAPQKFELAATAYVGQSGRTAARVEADYELLLTNRLILQPRLEANLFGKDDPLRSQGSGLATVETGLRLRYEITRRFAPYVGLAHERAFGRTAAFRRREGGDANDWRLVVGVRFWF